MRRKVKRKWRTARTETVPLPITGDEKIWALYSLCLICNRSVPDCFDDNDVSAALKNMAERLPLPHGFNFATWSPRQ
jgi:hypothetical protein